MLFSVKLVLCSDFSPAVGRFDPSTVSDKTLFELLVGGFEDKSIFYTNDGIFREISTLLRIFMTSEGEITTIDYGDEKFGGSLDFQYFPRNLQRILLWGNKLSGEFVAKLIPRRALVVFLGKNFLNGSVVVAELPDSLTSLSLLENLLSGTLNFEGLPASLRQFEVKKNDFSGSLDFSKIERPVAFDQEGMVADRLWMNDAIFGKAIYFELQGNKNITGDVLVQSVDQLWDFDMFDDTGVTGAVDLNGKRKGKEEFLE